jgi:hypothetical protein
MRCLLSARSACLVRKPLMLALTPQRVRLGPVGSASGERAVEHHLAQQSVHRLRRLHVDHVPDPRHRDLARAGNPAGQDVGHLVETGNVQLGADNRRPRGDRCEELEAVRVRRVRVCARQFTPE